MLYCITGLFLFCLSSRYCNDSYDLQSSNPSYRQSKSFVPNLFKDNIMCAGNEVHTNTSATCIPTVLKMKLIQKGGIGSCPGDSGGPLVRYRTITRYYAMNGFREKKKKYKSRSFA